MKQEAVNTFNEGLNYDLNPLTTPNNVLTDCINGTFITFNGDELALQNDAGNTKIPIPNTDPVEYVTLSTGFFPLGIKEYGGVLYIISGKLPDTKAENVTTFTPGNTYNVNNVVKYRSNSAFPYIYYKCLSNGSYTTLPIETNSEWELIGEEKDYNNYFGYVEIGSYPSPEFSGNEEYVGINEFLTSVYKPMIINNELFKTGRYVTFGPYSTAPALDNVSHYVKTGGSFVYTPSFYKLKLLHQLSNGYIDLTDTIWDKYLTSLSVPNGATKYHWIDPTQGNNFRFYCPSLYKGFLAISAEIEPIGDFRLNGIYSVNFTDPNYTITIPIWAAPLANSNVSVPKVSITYRINNGVQYTETVSISGNSGTFTKVVAGTEKDKVFSYSITPILEIGGVQYCGPNAIPGDPTIDNSLPVEFLRENILSGSFLITSKYDDIKFLKVASNSSACTDGFKTFYEYIITDGNGVYIDPVTFNESVTPYIFLEESATASTVGATVIETYTVSGTTKKPTLTVPNTVDAILASLFEDLIVVEACAQTQQLTISFNMSLSPVDTISVLQNGTTYNYSGFSTSSAVVDIIPDVEAIITVSKQGFRISMDNTYTQTFTSPNFTLSLGLIANVVLDTLGGDFFQLEWVSSTETLPTINPVQYEISTSQGSAIVTASLEKKSNTEYRTSSYSVITYGTFDSAELTPYDSVVDTITYANIGVVGYVVYEGIIFEQIIGNIV